ncbi:zinc carboxypeptidase [Pedobacter yulinensis]|uniref:Zinc carboxypeptidase n=1 Tax=Pedobacter yulinensis TaxID=2126353 RepID=A0A2T3HRH4_9SPHI|nr:M14 metallopeptidase family protein [Pedobacter yulinensis]PST85003.1 zinc carboxypeptidase [Pedobacter yulinensis]
MKKLLFFFALLPALASAQLVSPDTFLGYELGTQFTAHARVAAYFRQVSAAAKNVRLVSYGKSYEGRELIAAFISSEENIAKLEKIRENNLAMTGLGEQTALMAEAPAILWMSYNVHGNEANSTETAMKVLYDLASGRENISKWLRNTVVVIDPCLNPDGRERYISWYTSVAGARPNPDPAAREHAEPWPGGRTNHYYFDLNRDWAWQTQQETAARLRLYNQWMPQVHVDFHEQSYNEPYYFAPAAEPVHRDITPWQRSFQVVAGKNNARYFDANGWQYFTKERFDLLYPSYGDTYPLYNGAIGMTYEQGGIGAGLTVVTADGDTLTLKDRIAHHHTTSLATLETVSQHAPRLISEFKKYFEAAMAPKTEYRSYLVKGDDQVRISALTALLDKNQIRYKFGGDAFVPGFSYETMKMERVRVGRNDLIINSRQPKSVLVNVLFEPQTYVADSNTYDITAWALPYAYGMKAYALKEPLTGTFDAMEDVAAGGAAPDARAYAWVLKCRGYEDMRLVEALQRQGVKFRIADDDFAIADQSFARGSLLVYRNENERSVSGLVKRLEDAARQYKRDFVSISSGFAARGRDLGSSPYRVMRRPRIGVVSGPETAAQGLGEIWHFLEQELGLQATLVNGSVLAGNLDLHKFNTLVIPDGNYRSLPAEALGNWVATGGRLIVIGGAAEALTGKKPFDLKMKMRPEEKNAVSQRKYNEKENFSESIPGAIYRVHMDKTHPLSFGMTGGLYYSVKTDDMIFEYLKEGYNVGSVDETSFRAGMAGSKVRARLKDGALLSVQPLGKGQVVYMADDPVFRSFWYSGKQLLVNALFF